MSSADDAAIRNRQAGHRHRRTYRFLMMACGHSRRWRLVAAGPWTERGRDMAYIAFDTIDSGRTIDRPAARSASTVENNVKADVITAADVARAEEARLGPLEWAVVALARKDSLSSLRAPGRLSTALRMVLRQNNPRLADERLEALRRMAVLAWHHSFQVSSRELRTFFDAGFTVGQYEAMMGSIVAARAGESRRR